MSWECVISIFFLLLFLFPFSSLPWSSLSKTRWNLHYELRGNWKCQEFKLIFSLLCVNWVNFWIALIHKLISSYRCRAVAWNSHYNKQRLSKLQALWAFVQKDELSFTIWTSCKAVLQNSYRVIFQESHLKKKRIYFTENRPSNYHGTLLVTHSPYVCHGLLLFCAVCLHGQELPFCNKMSGSFSRVYKAHQPSVQLCFVLLQTFHAVPQAFSVGE